MKVFVVNVLSPAISRKLLVSFPYRALTSTSRDFLCFLSFLGRQKSCEISWVPRLQLWFVIWWCYHISFLKEKIALVPTGHRNVKTTKEFNPLNSLGKLSENPMDVTKEQEREKRKRKGKSKAVFISPKPRQQSTLQLPRSISLDFITGNEMSEKWESLMKAQVPTHCVIITFHQFQHSLASFVICSLFSHSSPRDSHSFTLLPFNTQTSRNMVSDLMGSAFFLSSWVCFAA